MVTGHCDLTSVLVHPSLSFKLDISQRLCGDFFKNSTTVYCDLTSVTFWNILSIICFTNISRKFHYTWDKHSLGHEDELNMSLDRHASQLHVWSTDTYNSNAVIFIILEHLTTRIHRMTCFNVCTGLNEWDQNNVRKLQYLECIRSNCSCGVKFLFTY